MNLYVDESRPCPPGWMPARTITEAIEILATHEVHTVSLDYDIDLFIDVEVPSRRGVKTVQITVRSEETWASVARYVALMPEKDTYEHGAVGGFGRPKVQYHTANPKGEAIMRDILDE